MYYIYNKLFIVCYNPVHKSRHFVTSFSFVITCEIFILMEEIKINNNNKDFKVAL